MKNKFKERNHTLAAFMCALAVAVAGTLAACNTAQCYPFQEPKPVSFTTPSAEFVFAKGLTVYARGGDLHATVFPTTFLVIFTMAVLLLPWLTLGTRRLIKRHLIQPVPYPVTHWRPIKEILYVGYEDTSEPLPKIPRKHKTDP